MNRRTLLKTVGASVALPSVAGQATAQEQEEDAEHRIEAANADWGELKILNVLIPPSIDGSEIVIQAGGTTERYVIENLRTNPEYDLFDEDVYSFVHKSESVSVWVDGREIRVNDMRVVGGEPSFEDVQYSRAVDDVMYYAVRFYDDDSDHILARSYEIREAIDTLSIEVYDREKGEWDSYEHIVDKMVEEFDGEEMSWVSVYPSTEADIVDVDDFANHFRKRVMAVEDGERKEVPFYVSVSSER